MLTIAIIIGFVLVGLATVLTLWRLALGPTMADRILALDTLAIDAIALVVLMGLSRGSSFSFEAALLIAMMGFVGTVALCKYLIGRAIIE
ncbi:MAG: K+/H+ antiporter subunit F [Hyphomicrobium sp. 32-62-53]|jgi:multicomponent K+:H+ antiporter subunit F|nr:MAG: K+/H+ antiporter subunit F [Hyphomicrobium sp. 12-62-95]OYX99208.1 MAG: K+/H+ antiporter subunit F [Hyphomicrobium sp. 32-62-53]